MFQFKKYYIFLMYLSLSFLLACSSPPEVKTEAPPPPPKESDEEIAKRLNKELVALEIEGFGPGKTVLSDTYFKNWSSKFLPKLKEIKPQVPSGYKLFITGHADPDDGETMAEKIGNLRAEHILSRIEGLDKELVKGIGTKSFGSSDYEKESTQSISENRRVEFEVLKKK